jgi:hypothetical protein
VLQRNGTGKSAPKRRPRKAATRSCNIANYDVPWSIWKQSCAAKAVMEGVSTRRATRGDDDTDAPEEGTSGLQIGGRPYHQHRAHGRLADRTPLRQNKTFSLRISATHEGVGSVSSNLPAVSAATWTPELRGLSSFGGFWRILEDFVPEKLISLDFVPKRACVRERTIAPSLLRRACVTAQD